MLNITQKILTNHNRPKKKLRKLKGIVIHYTANYNKGANAMANRNYFNSTTTAASAHFIVDDKTIVLAVPEDELAYHVGAKKYTKTGNKFVENVGQTYYGPNYFLIGIEMCVNVDGNWEKTYRNTVELTAYLMKKHKLTINDIYRHYDITEKICPKMMIDQKEWNKFKDEVKKEHDKLVQLDKYVGKKYIVHVGVLNIRTAPNGQVLGQYKKGDIVSVYDYKDGWAKTEKGWVFANYIQLKK